MTDKFQAGVGPSMGNCHIYKVGDDPRLTLCGATVVARNYKGAISFANSRLCKRCFRKLQERLPPDAAITAELIGVSGIED